MLIKSLLVCTKCCPNFFLAFRALRHINHDTLALVPLIVVFSCLFLGIVVVVVVCMPLRTAWTVVFSRPAMNCCSELSMKDALWLCEAVEDRPSRRKTSFRLSGHDRPWRHEHRYHSWLHGCRWHVNVWLVLSDCRKRPIYLRLHAICLWLHWLSW